MSTSSSEDTGPSYSFGSTRVRETSAIPVGLRSRVPAKITSSMRTPRRLLADCSPSTQEMASAMLDFPHPLGPTTAAMPSPGNFSSVRSQKDLNPRICSFFNLSNVLLLEEWPTVCTSRKKSGNHGSSGSAAAAWLGRHPAEQDNQPQASSGQFARWRHLSARPDRAYRQLHARVHSPRLNHPDGRAVQSPVGARLQAREHRSRHFSLTTNSIRRLRGAGAKATLYPDAT